MGVKINFYFFLKFETKNKEMKLDGYFLLVV